MKQIGIGLAGFGTVGAGVFKHLALNRALLSERLGLTLEVRRIAVRDPKKSRSIEAPASLFTANWQEVVDDPNVQIVVELMGGIEEARALIIRAIEAGKIVVTGNKALLAEHGKEIFDLASARQVPVFFEAAVAGGIPIIKAVRESFVGNHIQSIHGIINGTTNYILTRMTDAGIDYADALAEAQSQGYAEADPTLDVNGWDAAHKAIILASLAYGTWISPSQVFVEGIEQVTARDVAFARKLGYRIKLLGIARRTEKGIELRTHPTLIPEKRLLANVEGAMNAVVVHGDAVGTTLYYGKGAGAEPTASAVVADLVDVTRLHTADPEHRVPHLAFQPDSLSSTPILPIEDVTSSYYLRLRVADVTGVLANITRILADKRISIDALLQKESEQVDGVDKGETDIILITHETVERNVNAAIREIEALSTVVSQVTKLRMEALN